MLHSYEWNAQEIIKKYKENPHDVLTFSHVKPRVPKALAAPPGAVCAVCANSPALNKFSALACGHSFCNECWAMHFEVQIMQGNLLINKKYILMT